MQGKDFEGIGSYEDCLPIVHEKLKGRMKWVWGHDLEAEYIEARERAGLARAKPSDEVVGKPQMTSKIAQHDVSVTEVVA